MNILEKIKEFITDKKLKNEKLQASFNIRVEEIKKRNKHRLINCEILPLILRKQYIKKGYYEINDATKKEANQFFNYCKQQGVIDELNNIKE